MLTGQVGNVVSVTRVLVLSLHLVNTFLLLASLALCANSAGPIAPSEPDNSRRPDQLGQCGVDLRTWFSAGLLGVVAVGVSGTIVALGDTLFPTASLAEGLRQDFSQSQSQVLRAAQFLAPWAIGLRSEREPERLVTTPRAIAFVP